MFKTFVFGVLLGAAAAGALLYFVPFVDQGRERSIVTVQANGGNREAFHVNLPGDRIFAGRAGADSTVPAGVDWPEFLNRDNLQTELFKIRNAEERVVGIASRMSAEGEQAFVEWALHMPARGTLYFLLDQRPTDTGNRVGRLRTGTREFDSLRGTLVERYQAEVDDSDEATSGRLELIAALVGLSDSLAPIEGNDPLAGDGQ